MWQAEPIGLFTERDLLGDQGWQRPECDVVDVSPTELKAFFTNISGGGLYSEGEFFDMARNRALKRIRDSHKHYSGMTKDPVPGLKRVHSGNWRKIYN
jgi:hypothetical protein